MCDVTHLQDTGKITGQSVGTAVAAGHSHNRLPFVFDYNTKLKFLINTDTKVSAIPHESDKRNLQKAHFFLQAASGTKISIYGQKLLTLSLGLGGVFPFLFTIADVEQPTIGSDFLSHFGLIVDFGAQRLRDSQIALTTRGKAISIN